MEQKIHTKVDQKYLTREMTPVDSANVAMMREVESDQITTIENRFDLLKPGYLDVEIGYGSLPNGTAFLANYLKMPNVTSKMFQWWFAWHGLDKQRYAIWNKKCHFDVKSDKHEQLKNDALTYEQRIWGVTHVVTEDTGNGPEDIKLQFNSPMNFGFGMTELKNSSTDVVATANGSTAYMLHTTRNIPGGIELRSRFWLGYNIDMLTKEPKLLLPEGQKVPVEVAKNLGLHSIEEMTNLATILPDLYAEYKNKF